MTLKFCLGNEIHRSSDVPQDFTGLHPFLQNMFQERLPKDYSLFYITAEEKQLPLITDNDYEHLKYLSVAKVLKVLIVENGSHVEIKPQADVESLDYEMIPNAEKEKAAEIKKENVVQREIVLEEEKEDTLSKLAEELARKCVIPDLVKLEADEIPHESMVKKVMLEVLEKQLPTILSQAKESLIKQGLVKLPEKAQKQEEETDAISQGLYQIEEKAGLLFQNVVKAFEGFPEGAEKLANNIGAKISSAVEAFEGKNDAEALDQGEGEEKDKGFFENAKSLLGKIPGKANELASNLTHRLNGDPYITTIDGRYPKSTVDKADQLKLIFPEGENKEMLDFIESLPKNLTMEQIASMYADFKNIK